MEIVEN